MKKPDFFHFHHKTRKIRKETKPFNIPETVLEHSFFEIFPSAALSQAILERSMKQIEHLFEGYNMLDTCFNFVDATGRHFEHITLLQYLYWSWDFKLLRSFYRYVQTHHPEQIDVFRKQYDDLNYGRDHLIYTYDEDGEKKERNESHFSLEDFISKLKQYVSLEQKDIRQDFWCKQIGGAQRQFPEHLVYQYCNTHYFQPTDELRPFTFGFNNSGHNPELQYEMAMNWLKKTKDEKQLGINCAVSLFLTSHTTRPISLSIENTECVRAVILPIMEYFKLTFDRAFKQFEDRELNASPASQIQAIRSCCTIM